MILTFTLFYEVTSCAILIKEWLIGFAVLMLFDALMKVVSLNNHHIQRRSLNILITLMKGFVELAKATWLVYGNYYFLDITRECILENQITTYLLLFVLIIGFVELAKLTFYFICVIIWLIGKCLKLDLTFE
jgi:hypothetical protein